MNRGSSVCRLNWGCGHHVAAGWVNCDIKQGPQIDVCCDIREGLPIPDNSFDYVVSIHALQEIPHFELVQVLSELKRVLVPGGILRLCLPDLDKALAAYAAGEKEYFLVPDDDARSLGGKMVVQLLWYGWSRSLFTHDYIQELLLKAGFSSVRGSSFRTTSCVHAEITELDNREGESLYVEGVK